MDKLVKIGLCRVCEGFRVDANLLTFNCHGDMALSRQHTLELLGIYIDEQMNCCHMALFSAFHP